MQYTHRFCMIEREINNKRLHLIETLEDFCANYDIDDSLLD